MKLHAFCLLLAAGLLSSCSNPAMPVSSSTNNGAGHHSGYNSYTKLPSIHLDRAYLISSRTPEPSSKPAARDAMTAHIPAAAAPMDSL
jgi:hypothetical protein